MMRTNELLEIVMVPTRQKETEIFVIEGTLSYANCGVRRRNIAVLRNSVNSPATHVLSLEDTTLSNIHLPVIYSNPIPIFARRSVASDLSADWLEQRTERAASMSGAFVKQADFRK